MANLKARIEGYVGSLVSADTEVEDVLSAERTVLIRLLPEDLLTGNATVSTVTDGVFSRADIGANSDYRVLSVFNETSDMYARLGDSHSKYGNNQSIYFADSNSPVYVVDYGENRETRIFPVADQYRIRYLTFGGDVDISQTTVDGFDRRTLQLFVLKGCAFELSNRIQVSIADLATAFYNASGLTLPTSPIANLPAAPFLTYTDVISSTYTDVDAALDEVDTIIQDLASSSITLPIISVSYADFNTAISNGDIELAQSYLSQIQTELSEYQAESQAVINEFTALNAKRYDSSISHAVNKVDAYLKRLQDIASRADSVALQNEAKSLEKEVSEYRLELERFGTEIQTYGQELQSYGLQLQSKVSEANDKMQRKTLEIQSLNADRQYYDAMYAQELQKLGVVQANG